MPDNSSILYYIHDPMCSWCWGFAPVWKQVQEQLQLKWHKRLVVQSVLGGLAPDTDLPMPDEQQISIRDNWRRIQQTIPGIEFNYDFWTNCRPRRSTYPACRAVIACGMQQPKSKEQMVLAIQRAYYIQAKNPSDDEVLIELADDIGLDRTVFSVDLNSTSCKKHFEEDLNLRRKLGVSTFPSLVLAHNNEFTHIPVDYNEIENILRVIEHRLED